MNTTPISGRIHRRANYALIILFIGLLWLPTVDARWKLDHCPPQNEKRRLADFPRYKSLKGARLYLAGLERYFNDHFGFRNQLVRWNNHWKLKLFNESPVDMAMQGRDGWLYWAADGTVANIRQPSRFDQQTLKDWQEVLETRRNWIAARGGKYIFVIAPDKHTIYPEYLPEWIEKSAQPSKLDQFLEYMRAHSTVQVLDLRPALLAAKKAGPTYQKTDTHWNNFGAFVAYQQLVRSLHSELPGMDPLPLETFTRLNVVRRGGDLAACLDEQDEVQETQELIFIPRPPLSPLIHVNEDPVEQQIEPGLVITRNPAAVGKVVVFRDSFAEKWIPFLGYHFYEAIYFRQIQWKKEFLERERPNLVIDEMVERLFESQDPRQLLPRVAK